ncbi:MAG: DNA-binding protein [Ferruginibacter sp.]|nr:DNA-binding protein [Ferruginibacter sp.]
MKIGILGSGIVGRVLATAFLNEGEDVMLGTRDITKEEVVSWKDANATGQTGTFEAAAEFGDLIVLATMGTVIEEVIMLAGKDHFRGKTVIDTTNPLAPAPPVQGVLSFFTEMNESLMEKTQAMVPGANFVKAFNSVGNAVMYKPDYGGVKPTMFICGNDAGAKSTVAAILNVFGWEAEDMGHAEAARAIEPLCILWCIPGFLRNEWTHAFKLLKR